MSLSTFLFNSILNYLNFFNLCLNVNKCKDQKRKLIDEFVHYDCARDHNCNFCVKLRLIRGD